EDPDHDQWFEYAVVKGEKVGIGYACMRHGTIWQECFSLEGSANEVLRRARDDAEFGNLFDNCEKGFISAKKLTPEACGLQTQLLPKINGDNYRGYLLLDGDEENSTKYELVREIKIDKSTFHLKLDACYHEKLPDMVFNALLKHTEANSPVWAKIRTATCTQEQIAQKAI
ncbi:unnamed protein product, partial [Prorocentrum cordatum]